MGNSKVWKRAVKDRMANLLSEIPSWKIPDIISAEFPKLTKQAYITYLEQLSGPEGPVLSAIEAADKFPSTTRAEPRIYSSKRSNCANLGSPKRVKRAEATKDAKLPRKILRDNILGTTRSSEGLAAENEEDEENLAATEHEEGEEDFAAAAPAEDEEAEAPASTKNHSGIAGAPDKSRGGDHSDADVGAQQRLSDGEEDFSATEVKETEAPVPPKSLSASDQSDPSVTVEKQSSEVEEDPSGSEDEVVEVSAPAKKQTARAQAKPAGGARLKPIASVQQRSSDGKGDSSGTDDADIEKSSAKGDSSGTDDEDIEKSSAGITRAPAKLAAASASDSALPALEQIAATTDYRAMIKGIKPAVN